MKIRTDFVTNSSSSSYIVATAGTISKEKLLECFDVPVTSPLYHIAEKMASSIVHDAEKTTVAEYIDEYCYEDVAEMAKYDGVGKGMVEAEKKGLNIYLGSASNEGEPWDYVLCYTKVDHYTDDFIFVSEGEF